MIKMILSLSSTQAWLKKQKDLFKGLYVRDDVTQMDWPSDLRHESDLCGSWTTISLRDVALQYIWKVLREEVSDIKSCSLHSTLELQFQLCRAFHQ